MEEQEEQEEDEDEDEDEVVVLGSPCGGVVRQPNTKELMAFRKTSASSPHSDGGTAVSP